MVRAHLGSRGRTSPPPTMSGIRLAPTVDQSGRLDFAGRDGNSLRIAANCVAEYVNGLYSPMGRTRRSAAPQFWCTSLNAVGSSPGRMAVAENAPGTECFDLN